MLAVPHCPGAVLAAGCTLAYPGAPIPSPLHLSAMRKEVDSRAPGSAGTIPPPYLPISEGQGPGWGHQHMPGHTQKGQRLPMYSVLLLGVSTLFIHSSCPYRSVPPGWRRWGGLHPRGSWAQCVGPAQADPPACPCRVQYEDEVLRKTVPAARRRPAWGESRLCCSSGGLGPAQGPGQGEGSDVDGWKEEMQAPISWRFAESTEHSRTSPESSRSPSPPSTLWGDETWRQCLRLGEHWPSQGSKATRPPRTGTLGAAELLHPFFPPV